MVGLFPAEVRKGISEATEQKKTACEAAEDEGL